MYGTIARLRVKPGAEAQLKQLQDQYGTLNVPGYVTAYLYKMDANPNEQFLAVVFENKDSYIANAQSPEQDQRYRQMLELLEAEPEWHDGEIISAR